MKDFVGQELAVGDHIVYSCIRGHSHIMEKNVIAGFAEKTIKIVNPWHKRFPNSSEREFHYISPNNCVKYTEV